MNSTVLQQRYLSTFSFTVQFRHCPGKEQRKGWRSDSVRTLRPQVTVSSGSGFNWWRGFIHFVSGSWIRFRIERSVQEDDEEAGQTWRHCECFCQWKLFHNNDISIVTVSSSGGKHRTFIAFFIRNFASHLKSYVHSYSQLKVHPQLAYCISLI